MAYITIREACGFGKISLEQSAESLSNSLFFVTVFHSKKLVGLGRIVGDGTLFFYITDVLVSPEMKGKGIGKTIMKLLISYLEKSAGPSSTIAVLAAPAKEGFYEKFGFTACPNTYFGKGMSYLKLIEAKG